jgi:hypothetical protein
VNGPSIPPAAFYCVADERYFLGAVAMINSLRLHGHTEPIFLLDCGLRPAQRERIARSVSVVAAPGGTPPYLLKTVAPMRHPAEVMALIDADMIVTRSLAELIGAAADRGVVAFRNDQERFVPEWGEILGLGPARRRAYVSSGLVFLGGVGGKEVLGLMDDRQSAVDFDRTYYGENDPTYPFRYPEQDVLNAVLCTRVEPDRVVALDNRLAPNPPFAGLKLLDLDAVRCGYEDGATPYVLHHFHRKPWLDPIYHGLYSRLLARLLLGQGLAIRVAEGSVPLRLRNGPLARAERARVDARDLFERYLRAPLARRIRRQAR